VLKQVCVSVGAAQHWIEMNVTLVSITFLYYSTTLVKPGNHLHVRCKCHLSGLIQYGRQSLHLSDTAQSSPYGSRVVEYLASSCSSI